MNEPCAALTAAHLRLIAAVHERPLRVASDFGSRPVPSIDHRCLNEYCRLQRTCQRAWLS
jgi:hypothetical protein